eukprot:1952777-Pleurochrysis_carterae.AAC.2
MQVPANELSKVFDTHAAEADVVDAIGSDYKARLPFSIWACSPYISYTSYTRIAIISTNMLARRKSVRFRRLRHSLQHPTGRKSFTFRAPTESYPGGGTGLMDTGSKGAQ